MLEQKELFKQHIPDITLLLTSESLDGSSNENQLRQYDKWSVEEEQIFFLKLRAVTTLKLLECFKCIAQHLPNKDRDQVRQQQFLSGLPLFKLAGQQETLPA